MSKFGKFSFFLYLSVLTLALTGCSGDTTTTNEPDSPATSASSGSARPTPGSLFSSRDTISFGADSGVKEVQLDATIATQLARQVPVKNATARFYVSDELPGKLAERADSALTDAGYNFAIPGSSRPVNQGNSIVGVYTKTTAPDMYMVCSTIPEGDSERLTRGLDFNVTTETRQKFADQLKGKKSALVLVQANGIIEALLHPTPGPSEATKSLTLSPSPAR